MNIARIVVLTIALSAGGVAAYLVSASDNKPADVSLAEETTDDAPKRDGTINVIRYGVLIPTTTQK
jgi:Flp pilus assembly protein CpaB